jgi:hypothetical protein
MPVSNPRCDGGFAVGSSNASSKADAQVWTGDNRRGHVGAAYPKTRTVSDGSDNGPSLSFDPWVLGSSLRHLTSRKHQLSTAMGCLQALLGQAAKDTQVSLLSTQALERRWPDQQDPEMIT